MSLNANIVLVADISMSRTYRKEPQNHVGLRHPKTTRERRQLKGLKHDFRVNDFELSPKNRINRHIPTSYDDLWASSLKENYYHKN